MKKSLTLCLMAGALAACSQTKAPDLHTQLIQDGEPHPLVILLGGSDGGNYFAVPKAHDLLNEYHDYGFSVAAMGYFDTESTPSRQIELSLNDINDRIVELSKDPAVNDECVVLLGFSKGAELSLLIGSYFESVAGVVAAYPTDVVWNGLKTPFSRSGWTLNGEPLNYIETPFLSMLLAMPSGEYLDVFNDALAEASPEALEQARIPVEDINGSLVLVSAKRDQVWPSHDMAKQMMQRLAQENFAHPLKHIALEGGHYSYNRETMDEVLTFLQSSLPQQCQSSNGA